MAHHVEAREKHFGMRHSHKETMQALHHPSDHRNKSHLHNATRHLTNESALSESPIESHLPRHHKDSPGV